MTHDHFRADFDRRFRRLLAGAAVVEVGAANMENFGRLPTALLATAVGELLLRRLLGGPVVTDTGAAVIEDCEVPYKFRMMPLAEKCFDQITTVHCHCPGKATSRVRDMKVRDIGFLFFVALFLASRYAKRRESHHDRLFASIGGQTD